MFHCVLSLFLAIYCCVIQVICTHAVKSSLTGSGTKCLPKVGDCNLSKFLNKLLITVVGFQACLNLSLNVLVSVQKTLLDAKLAFFAACSYLTKPALARWESKLSLFKPGENGFNPNKFKCVPVNPTPACANVEVGKYTP